MGSCVPYNYYMNRRVVYQNQLNRVKVYHRRRRQVINNITNSNNTNNNTYRTLPNNFNTISIVKNRLKRKLENATKKAAEWKIKYLKEKAAYNQAKKNGNANELQKKQLQDGEKMIQELKNEVKEEKKKNIEALKKLNLEKEKNKELENQIKEENEDYEKQFKKLNDGNLFFF